MKSSATYLRAAEKIFLGKEYYCCKAICSSSYETDKAFNEFFRPTRTDKDGYYYHLYGFWDGVSVKTQKERVLALLFMAAIAESEGR